MNNYFRLGVLLLPFFLFCGFELFFFVPASFYFVLVLGIIFISLFTFQLIKAGGKKDWPNYLVLPIFIFSATVFYLSIQSAQSILQISAVLSSWLIYNYLKSVYYYLLKPEFYRPDSLRNVSFYGGFLSFFFAAAALYGLKSFLDYPLWGVIPFALLAVAASLYQAFFFLGAVFKERLIFFATASLGLLQFMVVLFLLPFEYQILGILAALSYYFIFAVSRFYLLNNWRHRRINYYLIFVSLAMILILLTARWM